FITKLGFHGYPEFQESLRHEVQARLSSPLTRYREEPKRDSAVNDALEVSQHNLKATVELLSDRDVKEAVELLADVRRRVMVLGTSVETVGPFDSLVGAMAVVEALIAAVLRKLGPRAEARMQNLERLRARDVLGGNESGG